MTKEDLCGLNKEDLLSKLREAVQSDEVSTSIKDLLLPKMDKINEFLEFVTNSPHARVEDNKGNWFLLFRAPFTIDGVNISIEEIASALSKK